MSILEVRGLVKSYGRRRVVDGVDLNVDEGEIVGLLGPNGAGKTTTFRMTCGMVEPDAGQVFLNGLDVTNWPMYRRARDGGMGYLAQESSVFRKLNVEQNVLAMLELLGVKRRARRQRCQSLLEQFEITHIRKSKASKLSGGERRRLEIARCLVSDPEIIMLDEPFAGIDPVTVQSIQSIIQNLRDQGIAILITDHAAREILQTVDRCYVISEGSVLCNGAPEDIKRHPDVRRKYLGDIDAAANGQPLGGPRDESPAPRVPNSQIPPARPTPSARIQPSDDDDQGHFGDSDEEQGREEGTRERDQDARSRRDLPHTPARRRDAKRRVRRKSSRQNGEES